MIQESESSLSTSVLGFREGEKGAWSWKGSLKVRRSEWGGEGRELCYIIEQHMFGAAGSSQEPRHHSGNRPVKENC